MKLIRTLFVRRSGRRLAALVLCALLLSAAAGMAAAQSGRKPPKRPTSPDPLPPTPSEPPIKQPEARDQKPKIPVVIVKYLPNINSSSIYSNVVIEGCARRLNDSAAVEVRAGKEMNRKQASDYAKSTEDVYVVWIQLQADVADMDRASIGYVDPRYLYVDYIVFAPGTGKQKTSGHVYQRSRRMGGARLPGNSPSVAEYELREAGRETADRVFDALGLARPPGRP
jgi:hypothetical protein